MPELELDPKNYKAQPLKGEKVFAPGGLKRLLLYVATVLVGIILSMITYAPAMALSDWLWSLWH